MLQCEGPTCNYWFHIKCINMSIPEHEYLAESSDSWYCQKCTLPNFTDSFDFHNNNISHLSSTPNTDDLHLQFVDISDVNNENIFDEIKEMRTKHPFNFQCAYLNINSFRNKYECIQEMLNDNLVDMLIIGETKLDDTFRDSEFSVDNYHLWRADRTSHGGGILVYIRSDLACDRKKELECKEIESIFTEIKFKDRKWLICGLYRPPSLPDNAFIDDFSKTFDRVSVKYDNVLVIGDLNYNLEKDSCTPLKTMCDIFDFSNLVKKVYLFYEELKANTN